MGLSEQGLIWTSLDPHHTPPPLALSPSAEDAALAVPLWQSLPFRWQVRPWALEAEERRKGVATTKEDSISLAVFAQSLVWSWWTTEKSLRWCQGL